MKLIKIVINFNSNQYLTSFQLVIKQTQIQIKNLHHFHYELFDGNHLKNVSNDFLCDIYAVLQHLRRAWFHFINIINANMPEGRFSMAG